MRISDWSSDVCSSDLNQQTRAAALNLVTAAIILFNCRYLGHAVEEMRRRGSQIDPAMLSRLPPLGWDRINLTGDYVWSDHLDLDANGLMPLQIGRASCRERVCQYVWFSVGAVSLKKKKHKKYTH